MYGSKAKEKIFFSLSISKQYLVTFQEVCASACAAAAPEHKHHNNKWSPAPPPPSLKFYI